MYLEQKINILSPRVLEKADAICFTSNGMLKSNGALVMGAGVAKAFRDRFVGLDVAAGRSLRKHGNICQVIEYRLLTPPMIVAFPTKQDWRDSSDLTLIEQSARQLMDLVDQHGWLKVALPKPGCANGGLNWRDVSTALRDILDERIVITYI